MAKDINLNAPDWCDMVFEEKNKSYGAYTMRQTSGHRHLIAMFFTIGLIAFIVFLPTLIKTIQKLTQRHEVMNERIVVADVKLEDAVKEKNIERQLDAPPPPPLKTTVKFTAPEITDEPIEEGDEMKTQEELSANRTTISVADVKGTDEENGVDLADLENHKVIIEEEIFDGGVEQMPAYPGGDEELINFIKGHLVYPQQAVDMGINGRVTIRFVVNRDGKVSSVEILRSLDPACDKEALRVVKMMPDWIPGRQNGRAVAVYYTLPIVFKLAR